MGGGHYDRLNSALMSSLFCTLYTTYDANVGKLAHRTDLPHSRNGPGQTEPSLQPKTKVEGAAYQGGAAKSVE